jgi:hypothetical protein
MRVVFYTVNLYMCVYDLFYILLSLRRTWIHGMYVYMYQ